MSPNFRVLCFVLIGLLVVGQRSVEAKVPDKNYIVNGDFEKDLAGWTTEGAVSLETTNPLHGSGSLRIGPGAGAVRQRYAVGGLRIVYFGAQLMADTPGMAAQVRAQCFDAQNHLVMDLTQPLGPKEEDRKPHNVGIYFKTQVHTATLVLSIEKTTAASGYLYADSVALNDYDHDRKTHPPLCDLNAYMHPIWSSGTVTNETVLLFSEGGKPATGSLLFTPKRILSIRDYALSTTYLQGKDYTLEGKRLTCTADSHMPFLNETDLPKGDYPWLNLLGKHIVVTYTHDEPWTGPIPTYQGDRLPRTIQKLTAKAPLTIIATGDSITLGNGTSEFTEIPPYMPTWGDLFIQQLKKRTGDAQIRFYNTALGGMTSEWGYANAESAVASLDPDLVLIAFGMNDFWSLSGEEFLKNIQGIMTRVRAHRPNVEFLLIATMRFDPAYTSDPMYSGHLLSYASALHTLTGEGVALLDMTALSGALFAAKKPKDFLADPLHPNDFLARCYAQGLVALLVPEHKSQAESSKP